ncbi:MAG: phBC6A51 family helix-turn-helix protein [Planctomycetota bacterium]
MAKKNKLAEKQLRAIPFIVSSPTYTEGCEKAKLNRATFYEWLKIPEFKAELNRQRDEVAAEAFGILSQGLTKAAETLVGLLDNKDDRLKRLTAKDVIDFMIRHKEIEDLDKRLAAIEQRLSEQKRH